MGRGSFWPGVSRTEHSRELRTSYGCWLPVFEVNPSAAISVAPCVIDAGQGCPEGHTLVHTLRWCGHTATFT
jgi:hypothetical protein